ncbi:MAG: 30S ribosomal protein S1, partial [Deltaproteobacteria bacterium]|nr:30S ribosomal protein S1 [Deltaproteobacteria bacterium]
KGTEVEAVVLNMDQEAERTSLGIKQLSEDPWPRVREQYAIGTKHEGKVVWVGDRGIAAELEEKIEGFIERDPTDEGTLPQLGDTLSVIVHSLDERDRKILLGMVVAGSEKRSKR